MAVEDSVADDELAAFVDRVLRMKAEEDAIKADIREIYAEAKGRGYDKTRLGEVVSHIRKVEKDADGEAEKEAIRDLYLTAYYRAKNKPHAHAYARAAKSTTQNTSVSEPFDPVTGEFDTTPKITEQQDAPHPASDLTNSPSLSGQVAPIQPEAANEARGDLVTPTVDAADHSLNGTGNAATEHNPGGEDVDASDVPATHEDVDGALDVAGATVKSVEPSGSAAPAASYPAPGVVVMEHTPPEGALAHPYAACWPVNLVDPAGGIREPIVKIGKLILDGRGRMFAARAVNGGEGIEYPVVQYDGADPLIDCIRWNLASRPSMHLHNLKLIASKLVKLEPARADEIMQAFGLEVAEAAQ